MNYFSANLKFLRSRKGYTQSEFAHLIGVKPNTISNYENGVSTPDYDLLIKIVKILGVTTDGLLLSDLLNGNLNGNLIGNPLEEKALIRYKPEIIKENFQKEVVSYIKGKNTRILPITINTAQRENILFVPIKAAAGYLIGFSDPEFIQELPAFSLPGFEHGSFRAFEVKGDSMEPSIREKDIIIGQFVDDWYSLKNEKIYILVTDEGIVVKRVINRFNETVDAILMSDNPFYKPYTVAASSIKEIWEYRSLIRIDIKAEEPKNPLEARMLMLEKQVQAMMKQQLKK